MDWVIFSLFSRALWAADNIVDKLLRGRYLPDSLTLTLIAGISALLLSLVIIIFNGLRWIGFGPAALVIFAGAFQIVAVFAFYQAISKEEISRVIPLFQFTPPFVLILSLLFLGEVLTLTHYLAFVLILLGGLLISLQKTKGVFKLRVAFWWMVLSSLIYAIYAVILKSLYVAHPFWDLTVYLGFGEFLPTPLLLLLIASFRSRFIKSLSGLKPIGWTLLILGMFFVTTASLSGLWALAIGPVTLVSVFEDSKVYLYSSMLCSFHFGCQKYLKKNLVKMS